MKNIREYITEKMDGVINKTLIETLDKSGLKTACRMLDKDGDFKERTLFCVDVAELVLPKWKKVGGDDKPLITTLALARKYADGKVNDKEVTAQMDIMDKVTDDTTKDKRDAVSACMTIFHKFSPAHFTFNYVKAWGVPEKDMIDIFKKHFDK